MKRSISSLVLVIRFFSHVGQLNYDFARRTFCLDGPFVRNTFFRNRYASPARPRRSELRDAGSGTGVDGTEDSTQGGATTLWFTLAYAWTVASE